MATSIRGKRIARGASAGGAGSPRVRSAPSVQNTVIPRRGIVSYNPLAGASQVGAQIASRIEGHGKMLNEFFGSLSQSTMTMAEIDHHRNINQAKYDNKQETLLAHEEHYKDPNVEDYIRTGDPKYLRNVSNPALLNDHDYLDTRIELASSEAGIRDGIEWVNNPETTDGIPGLRQLQLGDNFGNVLGDLISSKTEGMPNGQYKTYYISALSKAVQPAINEHITDLTQAKVQQGIYQFRSSIIKANEAQGGSGSLLDDRQVSNWLFQSKEIFPHKTLGERKSYIIQAIVEGFKNVDPDSKADVLANFARILSDPHSPFAEGKKSFKELHPIAFHEIQQQMAEQKEAAHVIGAAPHVQALQNAFTKLKDPAVSAEDKQKTIQAMLRYTSDPTVEEFKNVPSYRAAINKWHTAVDAWVGDTGSVRSLTAYAAKLGPLPSILQVKKGDRIISKNLFRSAESAKAAVQLLGDSSVKLPETERRIANALKERAISTDKYDDKSAFLKKAEVAFSILAQAEAHHDLSPNQIRDRVGIIASNIYDRAADLMGVNPELSSRQALWEANKLISSRDVQTYLDSADSQSIEKSAITSTGKDTIEEAIASVVDDFNILPQFVGDIMADFTRNLALEQVSLADTDKVKEVFEKTVEAAEGLYEKIPQGDDPPLWTPKKYFRDNQARMLRDVTVNGKVLNGMKMLPDQWKKAFGYYPSGKRRRLSSPHSFIYSNRPHESQVQGGGASTGSLPTHILPEEMRGKTPIVTDISNLGSVANGTFRIDGVDYTIGQILQSGEGEEAVKLEIVADDHFLKTKTLPPTEGKYHRFHSGGKMTLTEFRDVANDHLTNFGFELIERQDNSGARSLSLEYGGVIQTEEEIARRKNLYMHELEQNFKSNPPLLKKYKGLLFGGKFPSLFKGKGLPKLFPQDIELRDKIRGQWSSGKAFKEALLSGINDGRIVSPTIINEQEQVANIKSVDTKAEIIKDIRKNALNDSTNEGTVSAAKTVTAPSNLISTPTGTHKGIVTHAITSNQLAAYYKGLLTTEAKAKGGLPNQRNDISQKNSYVTRRGRLIRSGEGVKPFTYRDHNKNITGGIGFNYENPETAKFVKKLVGEKRWKGMLKDADIEHDKDKKFPLTDNEIEQIWEWIIPQYEAHVSKVYKDVDLTPTQRLVILDLVYNGWNEFVGKGTEFHKAVHRGDWESAIHEVRYRSNKENVDGVQTRMDDRAQRLEIDLTGKTTAVSTSSVTSSSIIKSIVEYVKPSVIEAITNLGSFLSGHSSDPEQEAEFRKGFTDSTADKPKFGPPSRKPNFKELQILDPTAKAPSTLSEKRLAKEYVVGLMNKLGDADGIKEIATALGVEVANFVTNHSTPSNSSSMLVKDWILKNTLGIPMDQRVLTNMDLSEGGLNELRKMARLALSLGDNELGWRHYGNSPLFDDVSYAAIIGKGNDKEALDKAQKMFPRNPYGVALLGVATLLDTRMDIMLTIGQGTITINKKGEVILTDKYDAAKFKYKSAAWGGYGLLRDYFGQEGRMSLETQKDKKIKWRLNLGRL